MSDVSTVAFSVFLFFFLLVTILGFVAVTLLLNRLLGPKPAPSEIKLEPFECGATPVDPVNVKAVSIKYYAVAIVFILFDLEIVFMYPWAVVYRDAIKQGSAIFWSMLSFITILMVGYVYALNKGALDFRK